jgi:hypothetical protein
MITAERSNSVNITGTALAALRRRDAFRRGFDSYLRGGRLSDLHDRDEQRGWWAACDAEADSTTELYLEQETEAERRINDAGLEYCRRGMI